ncbi:MAG: hypothetical protein ACKOU7_09840 [Ferruginibacter sp.]
MEQDNLHRSSKNYLKTIIAGMILMFIIVQVGFHATYIKHFPGFTGFSWVHHIHGALMASWCILLVLQPVLIYKGKYTTHRFLGKLSYVIAPLIMISMFLIARQNFESGVLKKPAAEVMANQSITWMQLFMFVLFYCLAINFRKLTNWHMRFMIGTAIIMIGPPLNRFLHSYFPDLPVPVILPLVLGIKTALAAAFLFSDLAKKRSLIPYSVVLAAFLFSDLVYYARYSAVWQGFGKFVTDHLY